MVFQKKPFAKKSQTPIKMKGKKSFGKSRAMEFGEMDSDDGEEEMVKTPFGKSPKGKPQLSDKKVSFQVPGKNTPQQKSIVGKKQLTPGNKGQSSLQAFQGMGANGKRKADEGDSDDDDDEDDDEDEDDAGFPPSIDLDGLDESDSDDEDDDDDDEEDEDNEGVKTAQSPEKTPVKSGKTPTKTEKTPVKAGKTPVKAGKTPSPNKNSQMASAQKEKKEKLQLQNISQNSVKNLEVTIEHRRERDTRSLYIGNLPLDASVSELKELSSDIIDVIVPRIIKSNRKNRFAFLVFSSEAKAEENYKTLPKKKFRNTPVIVDFAGEKSKNRKPKVVDPVVLGSKVNFRKLFVTGLANDTTIDQVASVFKKSYQILFNASSEFRTAMVLYRNEDDAAKALGASNNCEIAGKKITVVYSTMQESKKPKKSRSHAVKRAAAPSPKKMKLEPKIKEDSDDEDDE